MDRPLLSGQPLAPSPAKPPLRQATFDRNNYLHSLALFFLSIGAIALTIANLEDVKHSEDNPPSSIVNPENIELLLLWATNLLSVATLVSLFKLESGNLFDRVEARSFSERLIWLFVEVGICVLSPTSPTIISSTQVNTFSSHSSISLCVFLRIYHIFRLLRDLDPLYQQRSVIRSAMTRAHLVPPRFDCLLTFKRAVNRNGVTCSLALFFVMLFIFAYAMLTIERYQDDMICNSLNTDSCWDDFWLVVWFSASTITTVGYGDMVPSTGAGRVVSIAMCVFGVVLLGFMFAAVNEALHMSDKARVAASILEMEACRGRERDAAARVLQRWTRHMRERRPTKGSAAGGVVASVAAGAILTRRRASRRTLLATADARSDRSRLVDIEVMLQRVLSRLDKMDGGAGGGSVGVGIGNAKKKLHKAAL